MQSWITGEPEQHKTDVSPLFAGSKNSSIVWMYGPPGSGKTAISQSMAEWCERKGRLGASFFCARQGGRNDVLRIIPTVAYQLSASNPAFANEVVKALSPPSDIDRAPPLKQLEKLIVEPLRVMKSAPPLSQVVIIDALDECNDKEAVSVIQIGRAHV